MRQNSVAQIYAVLFQSVSNSKESFYLKSSRGHVIWTEFFSDTHH